MSEKSLSLARKANPTPAPGSHLQISAESLTRIALALAAAEGKTQKFPRDPDARGIPIPPISEGGVMKGYFRRATEILKAAQEFTEDEASGKNAEVSLKARSYLEAEKRVTLAKAAELGWVQGVKSRQGIVKRIRTLHRKDALPVRLLLQFEYFRGTKMFLRPAWRDIIDTNAISQSQAADLHQAWIHAKNHGKVRRSETTASKARQAQTLPATSGLT